MLVRQLLTLPIHFLFAGWTGHHHLSFCLSMCRSFSFTLSPAFSWSPSLSICLSDSLPVTVYLLVCFCACLPLSLPHPRLCSSLPPFVSLPPSVPPSLLSRLLSTFAASSCLGLPYKCTEANSEWNWWRSNICFRSLCQRVVPSCSGLCTAGTSRLSTSTSTTELSTIQLRREKEFSECREAPWKILWPNIYQMYPKPVKCELCVHNSVYFWLVFVTNLVC